MEEILHHLGCRKLSEELGIFTISAGQPNFFHQQYEQTTCKSNNKHNYQSSTGETITGLDRHPPCWHRSIFSTAPKTGTPNTEHSEEEKNRSALMYENDHPISPVVDWLIQVFYLFPGTCLSSILVVEPSKTRSCPIKTSVVWVPGSWMFSKKNCHIKFWRDIEQLFILNLGTPTFFSQQISQDMGILEKPWHINSNFSKLLAISNIILNWPNYFERWFMD